MLYYPSAQAGSSSAWQGSAGASSRSGDSSTHPNPYRSSQPFQSSNSDYLSRPITAPKPKPKPRVLCVTVNGHARLDKLEDRIIILNKSFSNVEGIKHILQDSQSKPAAVLMMVPQLFKARMDSDRITRWLRQYVYGGGTLIFCDEAMHAVPDHVNHWLHDTWGSRWRVGSTRSTEVVRSGDAVGPINAGQLTDLPLRWHSGFTGLRNVHTQDAWYRVPAGAMCLDKRGRPKPVPVHEYNQTAVAFATEGEGWLGWIGDNDGQPEQEMVIAAMLKLDLAEWYDSDCSGSF